MKEYRDSIEALGAVTQALVLEHRAEEARYAAILSEKPVPVRRAEGLTWSPVRVLHSAFTMGGRPLLELEAASGEPGIFRAGSAVLLSSNDQRGDAVAVRGIVKRGRDMLAEVVLDGEELPVGVEHRSWTLDARFDERSFTEMARALSTVLNAGRDGKSSRLAQLREALLGFSGVSEDHGLHTSQALGDGALESAASALEASPLNSSQRAAVLHALFAPDFAIIHGPPGTGKTTALVELARALVARGEQVLCAAPSNAATDLLVARLGDAGLRVVRIGHPLRVDPEVLSATLEQRVAADPQFKAVRELRKRAERAIQSSEWREARALRKDARTLEADLAATALDRAQVVCCTLVGASDRALGDRRFPTLILDEAGQALEPGAWIPICRVDRVVLAGDPSQLPPTVKSDAARRAGLAVSLLEKATAPAHIGAPQVQLLNTQYRMHADIMAFPNDQFYGGVLQAAPPVAARTLPDCPPLQFIDTAGRAWDETQQEGGSTTNPEEAAFVAARVRELLAAHPHATLGCIAPYRAQVNLLKGLLATELASQTHRLAVQTVDGFQGRERDIVVISLTRSNTEGTVGFLSEHRRMNVAMTRARMHLLVVGDSSTLGHDKFYNQFTRHAEAHGAYRSVWEWA